MPALMGVVGAGADGRGVLGLGIIPEHSLLDSCTRLSISLEESVFKVYTISEECQSVLALMGVVGGASAPALEVGSGISTLLSLTDSRVKEIG